MSKQVQNTLTFAHVYDPSARLRVIGSLPEERHQFVYCVEGNQSEDEARPFLREELAPIQVAQRKKRKKQRQIDTDRVGDDDYDD